MNVCLDHVRTLMAKHEVSGILIVSPIDLQYVTSLSLSRGTLYITQNKAILFIDPRYHIAAKALCADFEVACYASSEDMKEALGRVVTSTNGPIGFDATTTTVEKFSELSSVSLPGQLVALPSFFSQLRRPKRDEEIQAIETACGLCEQGFTHLLSEIREGITEEQLCHALKSFWFAQGADAVAFEPIIAFGPNSACPHWSSSSTPLHKDSHILIDIGVKYHSYTSDMTRVVFFGKPDPEMLNCHSLVQEAYALAFSQAQPGVLPFDLDAIARQYLAAKGYKEAFTHGLGHGVGMQVHEPPRISAYAPYELPLERGDVITIEPGIYVEGRGGIRIENTIVIEDSGARSLFSLPITPVFL